MDMTVEEIKKALECCSDGHTCNFCGLKSAKSHCVSRLSKEALSLIGCQQAEIERLKTFNVQVEVSKKIEDEIKSEAIKEFADKLTDEIYNSIERSLDNPNGYNYLITDVYDDIDNLVKEMTEK